MTDMTPERFRAIVAAYGAEAQRWPDSERAAALAFAAKDARAAAWLEEERGLDAMLDLLAEPHGFATGLNVESLHSRVMAGIDPPVAAPPARGQVLWAGLGVTLSLAACLAGAVLGVDLSLRGLSDVRAQTVLEQTAMIDTE